MAYASLRIIEDIDQTPRTVISLVEDGASGQRFAFKRLREALPNPYELARLRQEFATLQLFDSNYIIRAMDWERVGEHYGILMEYSDSGNLQNFLATHKLDLASRLRIAVELVKAIQVVHEKSIIHRDINPRNILIHPKTLELKLIDFSIATHLEHDSLGDESKDKGFEGSLAYMSPEQTGRMNRLVDLRSDLYSCGITLFELLTGHLPFVADDLLGYIHAHIAKKPALASTFAPEIPTILDQLIQKLLEKNVEERYQTAMGLLADIRNCSEQWQQSAKIDPFTLGSQDWSEAFIISPMLYGREQECHDLLEAYEQATVGSFQLVAVAGHSGIGKTSLIQAVDPMIVANRGFFIKGKFDQFQRNLSLSAVLAAFRELLAQTLLRPEAELRKLGQRLQNNLGTLSNVILHLVPDFASLLTAGEALPEMSAGDASRRTLRALIDVLRAYGQENCPVALFLDDVQWADQASLELIRELGAAQNIQRVLLILAYRDNEVSRAHPLMLIFDDIEKMCSIRSIKIGPLSLQDTRHLVGDAVHRHDAASSQLAEWIQSQSEGNPFFITEVLKDIAHRKFLKFEREQGFWSWDLQAIVGQRSSDNVVQFLLDRMNDLSAPCIELLKTAACIGHSFDLATLARSMQRTPMQVLDTLLPALSRSLLVCRSGDIQLMLSNRDHDLHHNIELRFRHDRIQQAVDSLLAPDEKAHIHLQLARMYQSMPQTRRLTMELAAHYYEASTLVKGSHEIHSMLKALVEAAHHAKLSNAYDSAYRLLSLAKQAMPESYWKDQHELAFQLYSSFFDATFLTSRFQESEPCALVLMKHCQTLEEKTGTLYNLCFQYAVQGRPEEALETGRHALGLLGIKLPKNPKLYHTAFNLMAFRKLLGKTGYENLVNAPEITDPLRRLTLKIMFEMIAVCVNTGDKMAIGYLVSKAAEIAIRYGNCSETAYAFVLQASVLQMAFDDRVGARRIAETGLAVMERIAGGNMRGRTLGCYANFIHNWHLSSGLYTSYLKKALEAAIEENDLLWIAATAVSIVNSTRGFTLAQAIQEQQKYLILIKNTKHREFVDFGQEALGYMLCLTGQTASPESLSFEDFNEEQVEAEAEAHGYSLNLSYHYMNKVDLALTRENWPQARSYFARIHKHREALTSLVGIFDYHMYGAIVIAQEASTGSKAKRFLASLKIARSLRFVTSWAEYNVENFEFYRLFIWAIKADLDGHFAKAALAFDQALEAGRKFGIMRLEALVLQVIFNFYQRWGISTIARTYLQKLVHVLQIWGAKRRIEFLRDSYPALMDEENKVFLEGTMSPLKTTRTLQGSLHTMAGQSNVSIDSLSMIKASQALVGEVRLEALLQKIALTLLEAAGADRAALILGPDADGRYLVKFVQQSGATQVLILDQDLEQCKSLCQSLVRSVARSGRVALINDAPVAVEIKDDPYIKSEKPLSLLCVPMRNQGRPIGVIYLENRIARGAFSADRRQIVEVLATQAAMSIEKAQLYSNMEQKIEERTRDIRSILSNIQQGIFTIKGPQLTVDDDYSSHLETILERQGLARLSIDTLLFAQSNLDADQRALARNTLQASLGEELLAFELNAAHLPQELILNIRDQPRQLEIDWHPILDSRNQVAQILVAVRDVTTFRTLQAETTRKQMELERIGEILGQPASNLQRFFAEAFHVLDEYRLMPGLSDGKQDQRGLARSLHTLKGMARGSGLKSLSAAIHHVEAELTAQGKPVEVTLIENGLNGLHQLLVEYQKQFQTLVPMSREESLSASNQEQLVDDLRSLASLDLPLALLERLHYWQTKLAGPSAFDFKPWIETYASYIAEIAHTLHKEVPLLLVESAPLVLSQSGASLLSRILPHLFHNAVDHGLESIEQRLVQNKAPQGVITIKVEQRGDRLTLRFADDGRGLDLPGILAKGQRMGLCRSDEGDLHKIAQLIFEPGFSTSSKLTEISGRGVGMDAVQEEIKSAGGTIHIQLLGTLNAGFQRFAFVIDVPAERFLDMHSVTTRKVS